MIGTCTEAYIPNDGQTVVAALLHRGTAEFISRIYIREGDSIVKRGTSTCVRNVAVFELSESDEKVFPSATRFANTTKLFTATTVAHNDEELCTDSVVRGASTSASGARQT